MPQTAVGKPRRQELHSAVWGGPSRLGTFDLKLQPGHSSRVQVVINVRRTPANTAGCPNVGPTIREVRYILHHSLPALSHYGRAYPFNPGPAQADAIGYPEIAARSSIWPSARHAAAFSYGLYGDDGGDAPANCRDSRSAVLLIPCNRRPDAADFIDTLTMPDGRRPASLARNDLPGALDRRQTRSAAANCHRT